MIGYKLKGGWVDFFNNSADRPPIKQLSLLNQGRKPAADFSNLVLTHISGRYPKFGCVPTWSIVFPSPNVSGSISREGGGKEKGGVLFLAAS